MKLPQQTKSIVVNNAGVVLINSYIPILFGQVGLVKEKRFVSISAQEDAVQYLQFVITGQSTTDEHLLSLNKVLCGLPVNHPVKYGIVVSEANQKLMVGMIEAIIGHWPIIGATSVDGFRGNWLVRDGLLVEREDNWELTVDNRPYDLLINKSQFSFSHMKYQWMDKPLTVYWTY